MHRRNVRLFYILSLWLMVSVLAWPVFVLVSTLLGLHGGEARQINAWSLEPGRVLLADFLAGWRESAIITVPLGCVAVIDYLLLSRYRVTWLVGGILLPVAGAVIALTQFHEPRIALPSLVATGALLAVCYRLVEWIRHSTHGK